MDWKLFLECMNASPETELNATMTEGSRGWRTSALEDRLVWLFDQLNSIFQDFVSVSTGTGSGPTHISNTRLEHLQQEFHSAVAEYDKQPHDSRSLGILKHARPILKQIMSLNRTLEFTDERGMDSGGPELEKLIFLCQHFGIIHDQFLVDGPGKA